MITYYRNNEEGFIVEINYDKDRQITTEQYHDGSIVTREPNTDDKQEYFMQNEFPDIAKKYQEEIAAIEEEKQKVQDQITAPLEIPIITGSTVQEVTTSAQAAIENLAQQMNDKIQIITGQ